jgi:hydrogenase nickel incorporation protein HypA/HybF
VHELSLVTGLFEILEEKAGEAGVGKITSVTVRVGRLSGIVPDLLKSAFDAFKKGTIASRARLCIEVIPVKVRCRACGVETSTDEPVFICRTCGAPEIEILEGRELVLEKFEAEKPARRKRR